MEKWPVNVRMVLEGLVGDLKSRDSVSGICLFGSRSRGDNVPSSDVDLLVVDRRDFNYEFVERVEIADLFLDLDYVPEKWILKLIPPEVDQKLYEAQVLYERDGKLTKAKDLMLRTYSTPERIEIRTTSHLMEADIYLSRGFSAYNKNDFQSTKVNAAVGFEAIMKILIEVSKLPISNSHFIRALESSTKKFGAQKLYNDYVKIAGFAKLDRKKTEGMLESFLAMWNEASSFIEANSSRIRTLHAKVLNSLNYYGEESFLRGMQERTGSLIKDDLFTEAAHYMFRTALSMLENYAWLIATIEKTRFDYTSLLQYLRDSKTSPEGICRKTLEAFDMEEVSGQEAEEALRRTKEIILGVRQKRKELIAGLSPKVSL